MHNKNHFLVDWYKMPKITLEKITNPGLINLPTLIQKHILASKVDDDKEGYKVVRENYAEEQHVIMYIFYVLCFIAVIYLASHRYHINKWNLDVGFWLGWILLGAILFPSIALLILIVLFVSKGYTFTAKSDA